MRLDVYLAEHGYAESRTRAKFLIAEGAVTLDGKTAGKPSYEIDENAPHDISVRVVCPFVSVGGMKLEAALDRFGVSPDGLVCADIGSSTGGFTDCLIKRGAAHVYAIDSGTSQLHPELRGDSRVTVMENRNARYLTRAEIGEACGLVVCDVSFISQRLLFPAISAILNDGGMFITLIKPQFELDRQRVGKGVVTSPSSRADAVTSVASAAEHFGLFIHGITVSPVAGGGISDERSSKRGNREYLALFDRCAMGAMNKKELESFIRNENSINTAVRRR